MPETVLYLGFIFALLFCILNACQGVFIFVWAVLMVRLELRHVIKLAEVIGVSHTDFDFNRKIVLDKKKYSLVKLGRSYVKKTKC